METEIMGRYVPASNVVSKTKRSVVKRYFDLIDDKIVIGKQFQTKELFQREVKMNKMIDNINMIHMLEFDEENLIIFFENGTMDLYQYLQEGVLCEEEVLYRFKNLFTSLQDLHKKSIFHGDIKLENIVFQEETDNLAFIDLGFAEKIAENEVSHNEFGTIWYSPPEAFNNEGHSLKSDIYMLGVTMFICLTGELPFGNESPQQYRYNILNNNPAFELLQENEVSLELQTLLTHMIDANQNTRFSIDECIDYLASNLYSKTQKNNES